jgi:hypothetical protein
MNNYLLQTLIFLRGDLIKTAKQGKTIPYKTLMKRHKIPRGTPNGLGIGWLIGYVSEYESEHGRPLLSAIVVRSRSQSILYPKGLPAPGFLRIDNISGIKKRSAGNTRAFTPKERKFIFQCQLDVWKYWRGRKLTGRPLADFLDR